MATYSQATPYQGSSLNDDNIAEYEQVAHYHGSSLNAEDMAEYEQAIPYQGPSLNALIIAKYETDKTRAGRQDSNLIKRVYNIFLGITPHIKVIKYD